MGEIFPFRTEIGVRGYEMDSYGHANNAAYLNWLEHARWQAFRLHKLWDMFRDMETVVRHVEVDYRAETFFGDRLSVVIWPRSVKDTSFVLGSTIRIADSCREASRTGKIAALGTTVLVCVKPGSGTVRVPDAFRELFPAEDPGAEPAGI